MIGNAPTWRSLPATISIWRYLWVRHRLWLELHDIAAQRGWARRVVSVHIIWGFGFDVEMMAEDVSDGE